MKTHIIIIFNALGRAWFLPFFKYLTNLPLSPKKTSGDNPQIIRSKYTYPSTLANNGPENTLNNAVSIIGRVITKDDTCFDIAFIAMNPIGNKLAAQAENVHYKKNRS